MEVEIGWSASFCLGVLWKVHSEGTCPFEAGAPIQSGYFSTFTSGSTT